MAKEKKKQYDGPPLPKTVVIGGSPYRVTTDPKDTPDGGDINTLTNTYNGMSFHRQAVIWLSDERQDMMREILIHEVMHCCIARSGSSNFFKEDLRKKADREEIYVSTIAVQLADVLRDNPELVAYLTWR